MNATASATASATVIVTVPSLRSDAYAVQLKVDGVERCALSARFCRMGEVVVVRQDGDKLVVE